MKLLTDHGFAQGTTSPLPHCQPDTSFKSLQASQLEGLWQDYMYRKCDKTSSNHNTMVFHYLKEHLRVCLVCPECGMSYKDPSKFHHHSRQIHNLLFIKH